MRGKVKLCDKTTFTVSYKNYKGKTKTKSCTVNAKRDRWPTRGCLIKKVRSLGMAQVNVVCSSKKASTPLTWHGMAWHGDECDL